MTKNKKPYSFFQLSSAIFMIAALLWLTISAPFVYASQQELAKQQQMENTGASTTLCGSEEEAANPFGNSTEEKAPNTSSSFSEEYIHDHHIEEYFLSIASQFYKCENTAIYIAFHGELISPPPDAA